jgi:hypothetical protein
MIGYGIVARDAANKEMLKKHDNGNLITYLKTLFTKGIWWGRFCKY